MLTAQALRLLPWSGPTSKPCYLAGDGGVLSQLADQVETVQLSMGCELLGHADALLDDHKASAGELRFLATRLSEALRDAPRVAESRGGRLDSTYEATAEHDDDTGEQSTEPS